MKNLFFLLISASILAFSACDKDDDCEATDLDTTIIGEWTVTAIGLPAGDVEFNANGTFIDENDALIGDEIGGVPVEGKSFVVNSNTSFTVFATQGTNSLEQDVNVTSFTCDEINMEVQGFNFKMTRK